MKQLFGLAVLVATAFTIVSCTNTPTSPSALTGGSAPMTRQFQTSDPNGGVALSESDRTFAQSLSRTYQELVELGTLAESRGDHPRVKFFGRQMVQDYSLSLTQLREVAGGGTIGQSITLDAEGQQRRTDLSGTSGSDFDRLFLTEMLEILQTDSGDFSARSASVGSATLRNHTSGILGRMADHLALLRDVISIVL